MITRPQQTKYSVAKLPPLSRQVPVCRRPSDIGDPGLVSIWEQASSSKVFLVPQEEDGSIIFGRESHGFVFRKFALGELSSFSRQIFRLTPTGELFLLPGSSGRSLQIAATPSCTRGDALELILPTSAEERVAKLEYGSRIWMLGDGVDLRVEVKHREACPGPIGGVGGFLGVSGFCLEVRKDTKPLAALMGPDGDALPQV